MEVKVEQRRRLYPLLRIKKANSGIEIKELDEFINQIESEMEQEDIAWVRQKVSEFKEGQVEK